MKKHTLIFAALFVFALAGGHVRAQSQPSGREILERAVAALGGRERLKKVKGLEASGRAEARGLEGTYRLWAEAPGSLRVKLDFAVQTVERGFDGSRGWERRTGVRELWRAETARMRQRALFNPLLSHLEAGTPAELLGRKKVNGADSYEVRLSPEGEAPVLFYLDASTYLPARVDYSGEGDPLSVSYGDYRELEGIKLPFRITEKLPEQTLSIKVDEYRIGPPADPSLFKNPLGDHAGEPYEVSLYTIPLRVYMENDGVESAGPTASWVFNILVKERYGRALEPKGAVVEFYSGVERVKTVELGAKALKAARGLSFQGFAAQEEVFDLRQHFSEPSALGVDRLRYNLELSTPGGQTLSKSLEIPVAAYEQKTKLIFPLRGEFVVAAGHDFNEAHKSEWSQHYAYDVLALGRHYEIIRTNGETNEDFYAWGREIVAPAGGLVVYARGDIQDNPRPGLILPALFLKGTEPMWGIPGNCVVIDHGNGEYSLLAHLQKGSLRVKVGDHVKQGQTLGLLGSSGNSDGPHLHYQLMAGPTIFRSDSLPSRFENLESPVPKRGIFLEAK